MTNTETKNEDAVNVENPEIKSDENPDTATSGTSTTSREKMVTIRLPITKGEQGDVFVSVNNRTWLIQRGVNVKVPACVAEVLKHQEEMQEQIILFEQSKRN